MLDADAFIVLGRLIIVILLLLRIWLLDLRSCRRILAFLNLWKRMGGLIISIRKEVSCLC